MSDAMDVARRNEELCDHPELDLEEGAGFGVVTCMLCGASLRVWSPPESRGGDGR